MPSTKKIRIIGTMTYKQFKKDKYEFAKELDINPPTEDKIKKMYIKIIY